MSDDLAAELVEARKQSLRDFQKSVEKYRINSCILEQAHCLDLPKLRVLKNAGMDISRCAWDKLLCRWDAAELLGLALDPVIPVAPEDNGDTVSLPPDYNYNGEYQARFGNGVHTMMLLEHEAGYLSYWSLTRQIQDPGHGPFLFRDDAFLFPLLYKIFPDPTLVRTERAEFYTVNIQDPVSLDILSILAEKDANCLAQTAAVAIITHGWREVVPWVYVETFWVFFTAIAIVRITITRKGEITHTGSVTFLAFATVKRCVEEVIQCRSDWRKYISNLRTYIDVFFICAFLGTFVCRATAFCSAPLEHVTLSLAGMAAWAQALYSLRIYRAFGKCLLPVIGAVRDSMGFAIVMVFTLASTAHALYGIRVGDAFSWDSVLSCVNQAFRLGFMGDFDMDELEGKDPDSLVLVNVFFYATALVVNVVMMNLLIGVLSVSYEAHQVLAETALNRERACVIVDVRKSPFYTVACLIWSHATCGLRTAMGPLDTKLHVVAPFRPTFDVEERLVQIEEAIQNLGADLPNFDVEERLVQIEAAIRNLGSDQSTVDNESAEDDTVRLDG